jgi:hypothetical protein
MRKTFANEEERKKARQEYHRAYERSRYQKNREQINAARRKRLRTDAEYAKRQKADARASYFKHREQRRAATRLKRLLYPEVIRAYESKRGPKSKRESHRRHRQRIRDFIVKLRSVPCADCGGTFHHCVMEFDHIRGPRAFCVGASRNLKRLQEEIKKCDVVCANCHKLRTWNRNQQRRDYEVGQMAVGSGVPLPPL